MIDGTIRLRPLAESEFRQKCPRCRKPLGRVIGESFTGMHEEPDAWAYHYDVICLRCVAAEQRIVQSERTSLRFWCRVHAVTEAVIPLSFILANLCLMVSSGYRSVPLAVAAGVLFLVVFPVSSVLGYRARKMKEYLR